MYFTDQNLKTRNQNLKTRKNADFEGFGAITFNEEKYLQKLHFWEQILTFWRSPESFKLIRVGIQMQMTIQVRKTFGGFEL